MRLERKNWQGVGQPERVRGQGAGSCSTLLQSEPQPSSLLGKGIRDPGSDLYVEEEPAKGGASQTADPERRAHGKWDKLDVRASLPGRVHADRVRRPMKPLCLQDCDPALCLPAEINKGPVFSQNLSI